MQKKVQLGFTLIELMVGMVIAMMASLAIFQVLNASEAHKRTTTAGGDAMQSGAYAEFMLGRSIAMGGNGFANLPNVWGCTLRIFRDGTQVVSSSSAYSALSEPFKSRFSSALSARSSVLPIAPALIMDGDSDVLVVMAGQAASQGYYTAAAGKPASGQVVFRNALGINNSCSTSRTSAACVSEQQDLLLAMDRDSAAGSATCDVAQAKSISSGTVTLTGSSNAKYDYTGSAAFNNYSASVLVANLGAVPVSANTTGHKTTEGPQFLAYGIDGSSNLLELNLLTGEQRTIADNIVAIKAIYGVSASTSNSHVDEWVSAGASNWTAGVITSDRINRLRAVRLAVVARSALREKEQVSAATLTLFGDTDLAKTISFDSDGRFYRYKVYDLTIPLRNMVILANGA